MGPGLVISASGLLVPVCIISDLLDFELVPGCVVTDLCAFVVGAMLGYKWYESFYSGHSLVINRCRV